MKSPLLGYLRMVPFLGWVTPTSKPSGRGEERLDETLAVDHGFRLGIYSDQLASLYLLNGTKWRLPNGEAIRSECNRASGCIKQ